MVTGVEVCGLADAMKINTIFDDNILSFPPVHAIAMDLMPPRSEPTENS